MEIKVNELKNKLTLHTDPYNKMLSYKEKLSKGESIEIFVFGNIDNIQYQIWLNYNSNKDCMQLFEYYLKDNIRKDKNEHILYLLDKVKYVYKKIYQ